MPNGVELKTFSISLQPNNFPLNSSAAGAGIVVTLCDDLQHRRSAFVGEIDMSL